MTYIAAIYTPENEKKRAGLPFGLRGDRLFNYVIERPAIAKGKSDPRIEQDAVPLRRGLNLIPSESWVNVQKHEANAEEIARLMKSGCLVIYTPDSPETAGKDTQDFADTEVIQQLVEYSRSIDWLTLSMNVDRRPEVRKLISDRLKDLREEENIMRQNMVGVLNG